MRSILTAAVFKPINADTRVRKRTNVSCAALHFLSPVFLQDIYGLTRARPRDHTNVSNAANRSPIFTPIIV